MREKIAATRQVVPNCYRTQIPNFQIEMLLLFKLGAGPQKMVTVTLKWAKNEKTRFLESVPRGMFSLILKKKLKMKRNFKK